MHPSADYLLRFFPEMLTMRVNGPAEFFETLYITLYTTWRFWVKVFFFMPSKATPCAVYTVIENPQLVFSTYLFIFFVYFFSFFLVKRRITKKRLHTFFICTLLFATLGFLLTFSFGFFFELNSLEITLKKYSSLGSSNFLLQHKQYLHTMFLFLKKLLTGILFLILWAVLLFNNDTSAFTQIKTTRFGLWFFSILILMFFVWAGTSNEVFVLMIAESTFFFFMCTLYGSRVNVIYLNGKLFIGAFVAIKLLFFGHTLFAAYAVDAVTGLLMKNSEFALLLSFLWYFSWDHLIRSHLAAKDPTAESFINGFFRVWILLNFFIVTPYRPDSLVLLAAFGLVLLYSMQAVQAVAAIPDFAWKRQRKVLMFGDAPEAVEPEQLIVSVPFNSNVFHFIVTLGNVVFGLLPLFFVVLQKQHFSAVCLLLFLFSALTWFIYFTGAQLVMHFKTSSILDWRGLFLVVYHYNWTMQYTLFILNAFILASVYCFVLLLKSFTESSGGFFLFFLYITGLLFGYVLYRFYFIWSRIYAHFKDSSYEYWTDDFWEETSPFMRDFLYWRPIEPDDAEEIDPAFYGLTNNGASKGLMFLFIYVSLIFMYLSPENLLVANLAVVFCCYKLWVSYFIFSKIVFIYNFDLYDTDTKSFIDYMWYECGTYLLMAFLMAVINYFIITQVFLGLFWLLFFFTA